MYVCMYVCMYVYVHIYIYIDIYRGVSKLWLLGSLSRPLLLRVPKRDNHLEKSPYHIGHINSIEYSRIRSHVYVYIYI